MLAVKLVVALLAVSPVIATAKPFRPYVPQSACLLAQLSESSTGSVFVVTFSVVRDGAANERLTMKVLNVTTQPVVIHSDCVPWVIPDTGLLMAYEMPMRMELRRELSMRNPGPGTVRIEPGQSYDGTCELTALFPDLGDALKRNDVVIFWAYRFRCVEPSEAVETHAGVCLLKKEGSELGDRPLKRIR